MPIKEAVLSILYENSISHKLTSNQPQEDIPKDNKINGISN